MNPAKQESQEKKRGKDRRSVIIRTPVLNKIPSFYSLTQDAISERK